MPTFLTVFARYASFSSIYLTAVNEIVRTKICITHYRVKFKLLEYLDTKLHILQSLIKYLVF